MYLLILRNNASKITTPFFVEAEESNALFISLNIDLSTLDDGEYTYAIVPFYGDEDYASSISFSYKGNLLDSVISCPDGDVVLRNLHPQIGVLQIGDYSEAKAFDNGIEKKYLYE